MKNNTGNERGQSIVLFVFVCLIGFGFIALAVDAGRAYMMKAQLQKAADAAALAGAQELPDVAAARTKVLDYVQRQGFSVGTDGVSVVFTQSANWVKVELSVKQFYLFAPVLGEGHDWTTLRVSAKAEARSSVPLSIAGTGQYGQKDADVTLSVFGPFGRHSYGDGLSTRYLNNGSDNPTYEPGGYDFLIYFPPSYAAQTTAVRVEIFDPETYNKAYGTVSTQSVASSEQDDFKAAAGTPYVQGSYWTKDSKGVLKDAIKSYRIDEIRGQPGGWASSHPKATKAATTTEYKLYRPNSLPGDAPMASAVYGDNTATDMQWITPAGFQFNISPGGPNLSGYYRLNVKTTDGSSENGFNLRAGPAAGTFDPNNGTSIVAENAIPLNFTVGTTMTVELGYIPAKAAGATVHVNKFDTDVGAKSITYYYTYPCAGAPSTQCTSAQTWGGTLTNDDTWVEDTFTIPSNYMGGTWWARYAAGLQDTSVWYMWYEGKVDGLPGFLRLIE
jgi:hypothetical protein